VPVIAFAGWTAVASVVLALHVRRVSEPAQLFRYPNGCEGANQAKARPAS
jgi:hypothetical protein